MLLDRKDIVILTALTLGIIGIVTVALIIPLTSVHALVVGIVLANLFSFLWYWLREIKAHESRYRKLLEKYLDDCIAPLYKTVILLGTSCTLLYLAEIGKPDIINYSRTQKFLKNLYDTLASIYFKNFGLFALILPSKLSSSIGHLVTILGTVLENLEKNKTDVNLFFKIIKTAMPIIDGFRKLFGLEYVEKYDEKIKDLLTSKELIPEMIELLDDEKEAERFVKEIYSTYLLVDLVKKLKKM